MANEFRKNSPYTAALTGGGFLLDETINLLPLLLSKDRKNLLNDEKVNNRILQINSEKSRSRNIAEIERRFNSMPSSFWEDFSAMNETDRKIANLYVILTTYRIAFDFMFNVVLKKWNSSNKTIKKQDFLTEFNEISAKDAFVDSWAENTKEKIASSFITILRKAGMLDDNCTLRPLIPSNPEFYVNIGGGWFLEACLWAPYQIQKIMK